MNYELNIRPISRMFAFLTMTVVLTTVLRAGDVTPTATPSPQSSPTPKGVPSGVLLESSKKPSTKVGPSLKKEKSNSQPIDLPAPVGEEMKGVMIPQYDSNGRLTMNFYAATARKINEIMVELHQLKVDFFEKDGKDVTVTIPQSTFNLETKILSTDTETKIQREDFNMVGQSGEFDIIKRLGTMKGHVHTEIRNAAPSEEL